MALVSSTSLLPSLRAFALPVAARVDGAAAQGAVAHSVDKPALQPAIGAASPKSPARALAQKELESQVNELQEKMDKLNPQLAFVLDASSGRAVIQLTDRVTKEVIRQFPTEVAMQISRALDRFEKGQLVSRVV